MGDSVGVGVWWGGTLLGVGFGEGFCCRFLTERDLGMDRMARYCYRNGGTGRSYCYFFSFGDELLLFLQFLLGDLGGEAVLLLERGYWQVHLLFH